MLSLSLPQNLNLQRLGESRVRQIAKVVNILLVVWVAWLLAQLTWQLVPGGAGGASAKQAPAVMAAVQPKQTRIDARQIVQMHLFGVANKAPKKVAKVAPVNAPETRLKLKLSGLFASGDQNTSLAIIADPGGKENHYAVGDPLPGGAKLSEIRVDRIILQRNGSFETLRLPKKRTKGAKVPTRSSGARINKRQQASAFKKYRNEIKKNPAVFLTYVRATPARKNGKFVGFRLQAGAKPAAMAELGLKPGDIVTALNGIQIDSPANGMKALQALGKGDNVSVTILRGGDEQMLDLTLPSS